MAPVSSTKILNVLAAQMVEGVKYPILCRNWVGALKGALLGESKGVTDIFYESLLVEGNHSSAIDKWMTWLVFEGGQGGAVIHHLSSGSWIEFTRAFKDRHRTTGDVGMDEILARVAGKVHVFIRKA